MDLQKPFKAGYPLESIAKLHRDGYAYHDTVNAFMLFEDAERGQVTCHMAYLHELAVKHLHVTGYNALNAKKLALRQRQRLIHDPTGQLSLATKYGFSREAAQRLIDAGYKYEFGAFVRREKFNNGHFVTKFAFLMDNGTMRETIAHGGTPRQAVQRGYGYVRRIRQHGSLITAFKRECAPARESEVA